MPHCLKSRCVLPSGRCSPSRSAAGAAKNRRHARERPHPGHDGTPPIIALAGNDRVDAGPKAAAPTSLLAAVGTDMIDRLAGVDRLRGRVGRRHLVGESAGEGGAPATTRMKARTGRADTSCGQEATTCMGGGRGDDTISRAAPGFDTPLRRPRARRRPLRRAKATTSLWALARRDVHGPNDLEGDTRNGEAGDDTFLRPRREGATTIPAARASTPC